MNQIEENYFRIDDTLKQITAFIEELKYHGFGKEYIMEKLKEFGIDLMGFLKAVRDEEEEEREYQRYINREYFGYEN